MISDAEKDFQKAGLRFRAFHALGMPQVRGRLFMRQKMSFFSHLPIEIRELKCEKGFLI